MTVCNITLILHVNVASGAEMTAFRGGFLFIVLIAYAVGSAAYFYWVMHLDFRPCPVMDKEVPETIKETIESLSSTVDLGLTLSTTLSGLGAALLLGLKEGMRLTLPIRFILLSATLCFCQSALYGVWWRFGLAEAWLNMCPEAVGAERLQARFEAHFLMFMLGLAFFLILIAAAALQASPAKAAVNNA